LSAAMRNVSIDLPWRSDAPQKVEIRRVVCDRIRAVVQAVRPRRLRPRSCRMWRFAGRRRSPWAREINWSNAVWSPLFKATSHWVISFEEGAITYPLSDRHAECCYDGSPANSAIIWIRAKNRTDKGRPE